MVSQIRGFFNLSGAEKLMLPEALFYSAKYRWLLLNRPFDSFSSHLGIKDEETPYDPPEKNVLAILKSIGKVVVAVCTNTPWESKCLVQAFTAKRMLLKRGIGCTVYLGLARDDKGKLVAHAWTRCGDYYVTGGRGEEGYTVTSFFG